MKRYSSVIGLVLLFLVSSLLLAQNSANVSMQVSAAGIPYMVTANGQIRLTQEIATGSSTLGTTSIAAGACSTAVTVAATNVLTTDIVNVSYASSPTGVADKALFVEGYPTAGNVNIVQCNATAGAIVPTGLGANWTVTR